MSVGKGLRRANPSTIHDKFLVGYQGWFTCSGDGEPLDPGHHGWLHWFNQPFEDGGRPNFDIWPDTSECSPSELFPVKGLYHASGEQAHLFSSRHPQTVRRHFNWMAQHGVDGAFLQRFATQVDREPGNNGILRLRDEVGDRVREAAELEGRVFAIMYDVTGVPADKIQQVIEHDWTYLIREKRILDSPAYLKEKGKPVIGLWGVGFSHRGHTPSLLVSLTAVLRLSTPGGAYLFAGTPAHWRTSGGDSETHPQWRETWLREVDAISPWTVGRYKEMEDVTRWERDMIVGDVQCIKEWNDAVEMGQRPGEKVDYIPVVLPGGSGFNMSEGRWSFNDIKRNGGKFLWKQIVSAKRNGARSIYGAMWDEYDEGTALMPVITKKRLLPECERFSFMALDEDGYDLQSDWYMRICGFAAEALRSERMIHDTFPIKELQDYWATRPKYEEEAPVEPVAGSSSASGSAQAAITSAPAEPAQPFATWAAQQNEEKDEPPPPPYSLEPEDTIPNIPPVQENRRLSPSRSSPAIPHAHEHQAHSYVGQSPSHTNVPSSSPPARTNDLSNRLGSAQHSVAQGYGNAGQSPGSRLGPNQGYGSPKSSLDHGRPGPNSSYGSQGASVDYGTSSGHAAPQMHPPLPGTSGYAAMAQGISRPASSHSISRPVGASIPRPSSSHSHRVGSLSEQFGRQSLDDGVPPLPPWPAHVPSGGPMMASSTAPGMQHQPIPGSSESPSFKHKPSPTADAQGQWPPAEWKVRPAQHGDQFSYPVYQSHARPPHDHHGLVKVSSQNALQRPMRLGVDIPNAHPYQSQSAMTASPVALPPSLSYVPYTPSSYPKHDGISHSPPHAHPHAPQKGSASSPGYMGSPKPEQPSQEAEYHTGPYAGYSRPSASFSQHPVANSPPMQPLQNPGFIDPSIIPAGFTPSHTQGHAPVPPPLPPRQYGNMPPPPPHPPYFVPMQPAFVPPSLARFSAMDERMRQFEKQIDSLAATGTKLFAKLNK